VFSGRQLTKGRQLFFEEKVHPGDLAGGFPDLEMTWLLYCAGAATVPQVANGDFFARCHVGWLTSVSVSVWPANMALL